MPIFTFVLIILIFSIIVVFSQDFKKVIKKLFEYKSAKILLPLILASILVFSFNELIIEALSYYQYALNSIIHFLSNLLPKSSWSQSLVALLILTLIAVIPVYILMYVVSKKSYIPYQYPYLTSTIIWIINAMIWIVG